MMRIARRLPVQFSEETVYHTFEISAGEDDGSVREPTAYRIDGQLVDQETWDRALCLVTIASPVVIEP